MNKYLRAIQPSVIDEKGNRLVDVYDVLVAFEVTCPARAHAIKKLLCAGLRGKGSIKRDLVGAAEAVQRAIELAGPEEVV